MKRKVCFLLVTVLICFKAFTQNFRLYYKQSQFEISNNPVCHYTREITMKLTTSDNPSTKFVDYLYSFGTHETCYGALGFCAYKEYTELTNSVVEYNRLGNDTTGGYIVFDHDPVGLKRVSTIATCSTDVFGEIAILSFDYQNYLKQNVVADVTGYSNHIKYNAEFVSVPEAFTYPKILSPNTNGLVTTPEIKFRAPDFLANNFDPNDIYWYAFNESYGYTNGPLGTKIPNYKLEGNGAEFTYRGDGKCKPMQIYATVQKKAYNWSSSVINFQHSPYPNLELGNNLIVEQPQCTDLQKNGNDYKTQGHIKLVGSNINRTFRLLYYDKDGNPINEFVLTSGTNNSALEISMSPFRFRVEEQYQGGLTSCFQYIDSVQVLAPIPISIEQPVFRDIPCFNKEAILTITVHGNTPLLSLIDSKIFRSLDNNKDEFLPLLQGSADYDFTLSDQNGCVYEQHLKFKATEPPRLLASVFVDSAKCHDGNATVEIMADGGTPFSVENPYRYNFASSTITQLDAVYIAKAGTSIYPKVVDKNGCSVSWPKKTLPNPLDFRISMLEKTDNTCPKGQSGSILVSSISNNPSYVYTYAINGSKYGSDSLFPDLRSGAYTLHSQNQNACHKDTIITITEPQQITISKATLQNVRCIGGHDGSIGLEVTGGTGYKKFRKENSPYYVPKNKAYTFSHRYDSLLAKTYWFFAVDSLGCSDSTSYDIGTQSNIQHSFTKIEPSCNESRDGELIVQVTGGVKPFRNEWKSPVGSTLLGEPLHPVSLGSGSYILKTIDSVGCVKMDTATLSAPPAIKVNLQGYPLICKGQSLDLDAGSGGNKYEWSSDNGFKSNNRQVTLYQSGAYYVTVINFYGCVGRDTFLLQQSDVAYNADFLMPSVVVRGDTAVLLNTDLYIDSLRWGLNPQNTKLVSGLADFRAQQVIFADLGEQEIVMTGYYKGCRDIRKRNVTVIPPEERNNNDRSLGMKVSIIKDYNLFPNPNGGSFGIRVTLNEPNVDVELTLGSIVTGATYKKLVSKAYMEHDVEFTEDLSEGLYVLYLKVRDEVVALRFLVTNE